MHPYPHPVYDNKQSQLHIINFVDDNRRHWRSQKMPESPVRSMISLAPDITTTLPHPLTTVATNTPQAGGRAGPKDLNAQDEREKKALRSQKLCTF